MQGAMAAVSNAVAKLIRIKNVNIQLLSHLTTFQALSSYM